jgi:DNA-binding GntR family transcriptional regulator
MSEVPSVSTPQTPVQDGRSRRQHALEIVRNDIITGRYEPGERLIEATISDELGVSRGPVREALRQLESEGLVQLVPYRGAVVIGVSDEEVQEVLIPIRLTLERFSFRRALGRLTDADFAELGKQIWVMDEAARTGDLLQNVEADMRFHEIVLQSAGVPHTVQMYRAIWPRIRAYFFRYGRYGDLQTIADEHRELLAALQTRDLEFALQTLERHIAVASPAPSGAS